MKKVVALLLVMVMAVGLLAGCGNKEKGSSQNDQKQENQNQGGKEDNSSNEADTPSGEVATRDYFPVPEKEELSIWYWFSVPVAGRTDQCAYQFPGSECSRGKREIWIDAGSRKLSGYHSGM